MDNPFKAKSALFRLLWRLGADLRDWSIGAAATDGATIPAASNAYHIPPTPILQVGAVAWSKATPSVTGSFTVTFRQRFNLTPLVFLTVLQSGSDPGSTTIYLSALSESVFTARFTSTNAINALTILFLAIGAPTV